MYANMKNQTYSSPIGSPLKSRGVAKDENSPIQSPLKQPRTHAKFGASENNYKPLNKEQICGKPIEIIQGKYIKKTQTILTYFYFIFQINYTGFAILNHHRISRMPSFSILTTI